MEWRSRLGLGTEEWRGHFERQAGLSQHIRRYLFEGFSDGPILEVGCGTGAVTGHIAEIAGMNVVALDVDISFLRHAASAYPMIEPVLGDGLRMPFKDDAFAAVLCAHYLVWQSDGASAIEEMVRVLRPRGMLAVIAEPDHTARIDYPEEFSYGPREAEALRKLGADPEAGRKLKAWMVGAGLERIEVGLISTVVDERVQRSQFEDEWRIRSRLLPDVGHLKEAEMDAVRKGVRTTVTPLFYGRGYKPFQFEKKGEMDDLLPSASSDEDDT